MEALLITQNKAFLNKDERYQILETLIIFQFVVMMLFFTSISFCQQSLYIFNRKFWESVFLPTPIEHFRILVNAISKILSITHMNFDAWSVSQFA